MATLKKIVIQDFRNIELQEIAFSPNVNCISGGNGEGKTNLLDAIHYLSMTKSAFGTSDKYNFRHGTNSFALGGTYLMQNGTESKFSIQVCSDSQKTIKRDDKAYSRISEHIGVIPVVMISPSDIALVSESGEERRRFINSVLSQMDASYLADVQNYTKLLAQRNTMLKNGTGDDLLLGTVDKMMEGIANRIYAARAEFASKLEPLVRHYYEIVSGGKEVVSLEYRSDLSKGPLSELLAASREKDRVLKYTSEGVQRDDFVFTMNGFPIRKCGSQGQQKSFVVALKFAQYEIMKSRCTAEPILLLDDLFDKLDMNRVENLLKMVSGNEFGQIFLTDSNKVRLSSIIDKLTVDRKYISTVSGTFTIENGK